MKKLLIVISFISLLSSCVTDKQLLSSKELQNFTVQGDTILYKNAPIAVYTHWEYEINPAHGKNAKPIVEICIDQFDNMSVTNDLLKYVHTKHPKVKVQISTPK
jgi:hypothetical protein